MLRSKREEPQPPAPVYQPPPPVHNPPAQHSSEPADDLESYLAKKKAEASTWMPASNAQDTANLNVSET